MSRFAFHGQDRPAFCRSAEGNQLRPNPGLELGAPEIRVIPESDQAGGQRRHRAGTGLETVDAFNDGLRVAEVTVGSSRVDLVLRGLQDAVTETQGIANLPVITPAGRIVPVSTLATVEMTSGPTELRHRERQRTITIEIRPAPGHTAGGRSGYDTEGRSFNR